MKKRLGVLISGGGSNLQSIIDACENGILAGKAEVAVVISNKSDAYGLERAKKHKIPAVYLDREKSADSMSYFKEVGGQLKKHGVDVVCLAGFLLKVEPGIVDAYRVINIHPALLPKYGGKGMYGHHVHEAVINSGDKESGATVHSVDNEYDHGSIIMQERVRVEPDDTPETLAKRVLEVEHRIYPKAILKVLLEAV
ncbi:MAG: phosphoribosylglycinamide formyltransferase [Endomicrobiales bacterium]|nr:phosphoribosylglycinamide formyltransferase [Endomicrobiales bacterium]